jgi:hypothetical protein
MGRTAHAVAGADVDDAVMEERGTLFSIEDDLADNWVEQWAAGGVAELEEYLAKHLAFLSFLDES